MTDSSEANIVHVPVPSATKFYMNMEDLRTFRKCLRDMRKTFDEVDISIEMAPDPYLPVVVIRAKDAQ